MAGGGVKQSTAGAPVEGPWALPEGWHWERLETVGRWGSGGTPNIKTPRYYGGDIPWFRSGELRDRPLADPEIKITEEGLQGSSAKLIAPGAVLVAMYGATVGKLAISTRVCATNQAIAFCIPDPEMITARYLFFYLLSIRRHLRDQAQGGAQPNISQSLLKEQIIPVPPVARQALIVARIDELFAEVDDGEAALTRARDDLATWRKALLKAAVTGELTADWRAANATTETGAELLARILADRRSWWAAEPKNKGKRYKEPLATDGDALAAIPAGWTWATAEQIVRQAEYGTSIKCHETPSGPPVLRMGNIQDGGLDWRKLKYAPAGSPLPLLKAGDVLFNRTNSAELLGKSAVFDGSDGPASFASYIVAVRLAGMLPHYFSAWMNSIYGRQWIAQNKSQQVGQANLSAGTLMRMEIPVPPIAEQQRIVDLIVADRALDDALGGDLRELAQAGSTLRQSILAAAFRGDLA